MFTNGKIKIFGYGSLINEESLKKTCPSAEILFPAKLYGFIRVFNVKSQTREDACVLNIEKSEWNQYINGVCFEMCDKYFEELLKREKEYELVQIEIENLEDKSCHKAFVFRIPHFETYDFQFESLNQKEYVDICLNGCKNFGEEFLKEFKETTFIGDKTLKELDYM